jgi:hypothetical protein
MAGFRLFKEPPAGIAPHALHAAKLNTHNIRRFFVVQSDKVLQFHESAPFRLALREIIQELIDRDSETDFGAIGGKKRLQLFESHEFGGGPCSRLVNEVPAHGAGGDGEEMLPVLPIPILGGNQTNVDLVY